jgi:hypothetical protein
MVDQTQKIQEEVKQNEEKSNDISSLTKNMTDVLSTSSNPKHRNCKFLKFLNKLNHGAYTLEEDKLVKNQDKLKEFREIETQRRNEDLKREV